jgi:hypothetical protein
MEEGFLSTFHASSNNSRDGLECLNHTSGWECGVGFDHNDPQQNSLRLWPKCTLGLCCNLLGGCNKNEKNQPNAEFPSQSAVSTDNSSTNTLTN